jgi:hypothetical protein
MGRRLISSIESCRSPHGSSKRPIARLSDMIRSRVANVLICRWARGRAALRVTGCFDWLAPCDARSMTDKPRYQLRPNSVALSRLQWWIVGVALLVAAVGAVLAFSGSRAGTPLICLSILIGAFTVIIARGRGPAK